MKHLKLFENEKSELWQALENRKFWEFISVIKYADLEEQNNEGDTPLIYATWINNVDFIIQLIKHDADVHVVSHTNTEFIDLVKRIMPDKYKKIYRQVIKKHSNFEEERKIRRNMKKYNL